ncbi:vegetative cell wall protein gp1 [Hyalella azteca]|uniref:Vegetative cell wall protein gp1 n=1 Tax=Hyalella azteca TaxID=294128 RepID=A0A8B7NQH3_HYAAZ|nr:vegetative cell wall protein gp1 [Hyalella azteca]
MPHMIPSSQMPPHIPISTPIPHSMAHSMPPHSLPNITSAANNPMSSPRHHGSIMSSGQHMTHAPPPPPPAPHDGSPHQAPLTPLSNTPSHPTTPTTLELPSSLIPPVQHQHQLQQHHQHHQQQQQHHQQQLHQHLQHLPPVIPHHHHHHHHPANYLPPSSGSPSTSSSCGDVSMGSQGTASPHHWDMKPSYMYPCLFTSPKSPLIHTPIPHPHSPPSPGGVDPWLPACGLPARERVTFDLTSPLPPPSPLPPLPLCLPFPSASPSPLPPLPLCLPFPSALSLIQFPSDPLLPRNLFAHTSPLPLTLP